MYKQNQTGVAYIYYMKMLWYSCMQFWKLLCSVSTRSMFCCRIYPMLLCVVFDLIINIKQTYQY